MSEYEFYTQVRITHYSYTVMENRFTENKIISYIHLAIWRENRMRLSRHMPVYTRRLVTAM